MANIWAGHEREAKKIPAWDWGPPSSKDPHRMGCAMSNKPGQRYDTINHFWRTTVILLLPDCIAAIIFDRIFLGRLAGGFALDE